MRASDGLLAREVEQRMGDSSKTMAIHTPVNDFCPMTEPVRISHVIYLGTKSCLGPRPCLGLRSCLGAKEEPSRQP